MVLTNITSNLTTSTEEGVKVYVEKVKSSEPFRPSEIFVSNEFREAMENIVELGITFILANVGIVSNIIIILVFAKQGYKESMNVSMTAIAIWDLIKCVAGSLERMTGPISLVSGATAVTWKSVTTISMTYLTCFVTYVSSVQAAYVAVERCLCVSMPLLVKTLLTPNVTFIAMTSISFVVFGSFVVLFGIYDIIWVHSTQWNQTVAVFRHSKFYHAHNGPLMKYYNIAGVFWPTASFVVIIVCTVIIVYQLRKASKFRNQSQTVVAKSTISDRDKQVVKMLVVIIVLYAVSLAPRVAVYLTKYFVYDFYFLRKYNNAFDVSRYICMFFDLFNSTANLYVFLAMSSNFKATAKQLFYCGNKKLAK